ncbi:MAG: alginate export family protein [Bacteroidetes bacterium]|nr:alginate export family protein [Bacteroidota bacterium]
MNLKRFLIITAISLFFVLETRAQFNLDAQYRPRFEVRDGYRKLATEGSTPSAFISQRTRLSFSYKTEKIKLKFTPQDVRIWGDEQLASSNGVYGDNASIDLFEGYAEIKMGNVGWISVGRQQLVYDHQRLFAARNWNQNGITHDAVVFKLSVNQWNIHAGSSWNSLDATLSDNLYLPGHIKSLNYLWANRKFSDLLNFSFLHIASGVTETDSTNTLYFKQTTGIYTEYNNNGLKLRGNAYYQYGKNNTGKHVSAFLIDADAGYQIGNLTPGIGLSYLSGNKNPGGSTDKLFDVLYGSRHRYFGHMDYFRDFVKHTKEGGLADFYFYLKYKFSKTVTLANTGHYFQLAQINANTPNNKNLGYENDLMLKCKFSDWGSIESGYVFYLPTESLKILQGVSNNKFSQFFYLELTLKPTLFKQEAKSL